MTVTIGLLGVLVGIVLAIVVIQRWPSLNKPAQDGATSRAVAGFTPAQPLGPGESAAGPVADPTVLVARETALSAALSALETRTATVTADAASAGSQAGRAEALLLAFAARRALDRGAPLGYVEDQLRVRFGRTQPRAVLIVGQMARNPITLEDLRVALDRISEALATGHSGEGVWTSLQRELGSLVILRKAGTPSPVPAERVIRARRLLDGGQVEAARAEIAQMPPTAATAAWMQAAKRYLLARQALDAIEGAAILGQGDGPPSVARPTPQVATAPERPAVAARATAAEDPVDTAAVPPAASGNQAP